MTTTDYTYAGSRDLDGDGNTTDAGEFAGPHAVTGLQVSSNAVSSAGTVSSSYVYDAAGRTVSQSTGTDYERTVRSLDWDRESELAGVSTATTVWPEPEPEPGSGSDDDAGDPGGDPDAPVPDLGEGTTTTAESGNLYTAGGDWLLRTGPDGSVTLYVGGQEVTRSAAGVVSAVRYYSFAGQTVAMRTATGLGGVTSLVNDPHGTAVASVHNTNWTTTSVDKHHTLPFGGARGGAEMPGDRAFLGKTKDAATGLTLVGARWYDETVGRFLTVDPVMDLTSPQQWNAYAYANSNPVTLTDPSGLLPAPTIDGDRRQTQKTNRAFAQSKYRSGRGNWNSPKSISSALGKVATKTALRAAGGVVGIVASDIAFAPSVGDATCPPGGCTTVQERIVVSDMAAYGRATGTVSVTRKPPAVLGGGNAGQGSAGGGNGGSKTKTTFGDPKTRIRGARLKSWPHRLASIGTLPLPLEAVRGIMPLRQLFEPDFLLEMRAIHGRTRMSLQEADLVSTSPKCPGQ